MAGDESLAKAILDAKAQAKMAVLLSVFADIHLSRVQIKKFLDGRWVISMRPVPRLTRLSTAFAAGYYDAIDQRRHGWRTGGSCVRHYYRATY